MSRIGEVVVTERVYSVDVFLRGNTRQEVMDQLDATLIAEDVIEVERLPFIEAVSSICSLLDHGSRVEAIKRVRDLSGASLIDSKALIDRMTK